MTVRYSNRDVANLLSNIAARMQILGVSRFKINAYLNAAETIDGLGRDINSIHADGDLRKVPGIGKGIGDALTELFETGEVADFNALKAQVPSGVVDMMQVPDMGPKKAKRLWEELDITGIDQLRQAATNGELRVLKGFGAKSEEKILKGIELMAKRSDDRTPAGEARPLAEAMVAGLQASLEQEGHTSAIERIEIAGSLRRWRETIGDVDILVVSPQPAVVMEAFQQLPLVSDISASGSTKTSVILTNGLQVDLRVVESKHWGAALQYFTGSKEHNVPVREHALKKGWSLNEYGLTSTSDESDGPEQRFFEEESDLYQFLGLAWVPPEMRENRGELQAAQQQQMPTLIQIEDICGELHGHSTYSDGRNTITEMAAAAQAKGYSYWAVCDHSVGLGITQGVDAAQLLQQKAEIDALNEQWKAEGIDFRLLRGVEVEVLADGDLGLKDDVLAELDVVVGSIHSGLRQDRDKITERCLKVIRNPHVDILGHATGRIIGRRPPSDIDMERILHACAETGTVIEINAHPSRLDINDAYARRAIELGCKIAINSDAHVNTGMDIMRYGIGVARRAWLQPEVVINTRPVDEMLAMLK
ncbi:MAG: DNA polymerase/3'-5' exonuclease PolX [Chloroflexota bacterium]